MKTEFNSYLENIGFSKIMLETVKEKYNLLCIVSNVKEFDDIYFSEMNIAGNRDYFSLWTFNNNIFCKISIGNNADSQDKIVVFKGKNNIARFVINDYNYDLINTSEKSHMECTIRTYDMEIPYALYASGNNCTELLRISHKYFISALNP